MATEADRNTPTPLNCFFPLPPPQAPTQPEAVHLSHAGVPARAVTGLLSYCCSRRRGQVHPGEGSAPCLPLTSRAQ